MTIRKNIKFVLINIITIKSRAGLSGKKNSVSQISGATSKAPAPAVNSKDQGSEWKPTDDGPFKSIQCTELEHSET